jgi:hypothetical protein
MNGAFARLARTLNSFGQAPRSTRAAKKGRNQMSVHSSLKRTLVAISAAIVMSTVAVGAAVGPAQASGAPSMVAASA